MIVKVAEGVGIGPAQDKLAAESALQGQNYHLLQGLKPARVFLVVVCFDERGDPEWLWKRETDKLVADFKKVWKS